MIKISINEEKNKINEIIIKGHALYDDYGKDIVCSSVSSIVITTVNACLSIDKESINVDEKVFKITILNHSEVIDKLINNMLSLLNELSLEYPKNIKFL